MRQTRFRRTFLSLLLIGAGAGCSRAADVEQVPIGTAVDVTRQDGGVVRGTLTARDDRNVQLATGPATARSVPRDQITHVQRVDDAARPLPAAAKFREVTLPANTGLVVNLASSLGSDTSHVNDPVEATLTEAVIVDGVEILPVGSVVAGTVTTADASAKVSGRASLAVQFRSVVSRGETYALSATFHQTAASTKGSDAKKIGIPAAGGAVIGAIVGGKKGAGIGAVIGGGAGAAVVLTSSGPEVRWPRGTEVSIALDEALTVRLPIARTARE